MRVSRDTIRHWNAQRETARMRPQSRPRCPTCYGAGTILEPFSDSEVACPHCFGPGFDPYWMGPDSAPAPEPEGEE